METTTKAKHTPGPWAIAFGGMEGDDFAVIGSKFADRAICNLELRDYVPANARLIAAAPELLESLRAILSVVDFAIEKNDGDIYGSVYHDVDHQAVISNARAAIAKATAE